MFRLPAAALCASLLTTGPTLRTQAQATVRAGRSDAAQTKVLQEATAAFQSGLASFEKGDLVTARRWFEQAVRLEPKIPTAHSALGVVLLKSGDSTRAVKELEVARQLSPNDSTTLLNLAVALSADHQYENSIKTLRQLQEIDPGLEGAVARDAAIPLAVATSENGNLSEAEDLLRRAVSASPGDAEIADALGTTQARQAHYAEALTTLRRASELNDTSAPTHFHLGSVELELKQFAEAEQQLTRAHDLEPANTTYILQLAKARMSAGHEDQAIKVLREGLAYPKVATADAVELRYRLALTLQASDHANEALPLFEVVLQSRPEDAGVLTNAGLAHVQTGDAVSGIPLYLRALKLQPKDATLREDLGVAYLQQSDLDHALEQFRAGLAIDDNSPQLHYDLALALKLKDDLAAAILEFQRAAALDPTLPDPPYTLGIIFMQQGKFTEAAQSFEKTLSLSPANGDAWAELGSVYRQLDQPEKAEPALRRAIELLPQQPSPHITLAAILSAQGKREQAAIERKLGADLTRIAVNRQKADFGLDSGRVLLKRGQVAEALVQFQDAVAAGPSYAAAHAGLAESLDRSGRNAEAAEERRKAQELLKAPTAK